jgi:MFS family permease
MQFIGQEWLIYDLTGNGSSIGLTVAAQFFPVVVLAGWAGRLADRSDKRRILVITQVVSAVIAIVLGTLTVSGLIQPWMVIVLAVALGTASALEYPTRQTFVLEMVGPSYLLNAVTLHSMVTNLARILGPVVAGVAIATVGVGVCFLLNAVSFVAVIIALLLIRTGELHPLPAREHHERTRFRDGLAYVARTRHLRTPLLVMAVVSAFGYSYDVVLPILAEETFGGGAALFATMVTVMAIGALIGGFATATYFGASLRLMSLVTILFGAALAGTGAVPLLGVDLGLLFVAGGSGLMVMSFANTAVQLGVDAAMRGRVMSMWSLSFQGTRPIGAIVVGFVCVAAGPRVGLLMMGGVLLTAGVLSIRVPSTEPVPIGLPGLQAIDQGVDPTVA